MAARPQNVQARADLTDFAHALMQDMEAIRRIANILCPVVPVGGTTGQYNKFDDTQAFKVYAEMVARRAIGGQAQAITFLSEPGTYTTHPSGLRISVDAEERRRAGDQVNLLEQGKTRTLLVNCWVAHLSQVITAIKAAVSATAGKGDWNDGNVDPIQELNDLIKAVWLATGMVPNHVTMDFGAWCVFAGNPKIIARMPGADIAQVSPDRVRRLLVNPNATIEIVETAILSGGGLGNASATKAGIMGGSALVYYNSPFATPYDPSFSKVFAQTGNLFTEVFSYREEPHLDWYENDWSSDVQVIASSLCKRVDVTGAGE